MHHKAMAPKVTCRGGSQDVAAFADSEATLCTVAQLLDTFSWPLCTSRNNAKPEGTDSILAMCLGAIKPYYAPITCSVRTRMLPNLARMLCKFIRSPARPRGFQVYQHPV